LSLESVFIVVKIQVLYFVSLSALMQYFY
jgi:hypothetical protein